MLPSDVCHDCLSHDLVSVNNELSLQFGTRDVDAGCVAGQHFGMLRPRCLSQVQHRSHVTVLSFIRILILDLIYFVLLKKVSIMEDTMYREKTERAKSSANGHGDSNVGSAARVR